jgi:hypothetical protein
MATIIREVNGKEEKHFSPSALLMILEFAFRNGWGGCGEDLDVFSEGASEGLCAALGKATRRIAESCLPKEYFEKDMDSDSFISEMVKRNQLELIAMFLEFCAGHPFRIKYEN